MIFFGVLIGFLISLIVSIIIIYLAAKLLGEKEGIGIATIAGLVGAIIFGFASYFIGIWWVAALVGGIAWLIALGTLYQMGWLKSLAVAAVIWIFAALVSLVLPTITGPL
jgi:hypothetical protein